MALEPITINPSTGVSATVDVAFDEVAGVGKFQMIKQDIGGDGVSVPFTDPATGARQATGNASLASIVTAVDGIEALQGTGNASLAAIAGSVDTLEALIGSTNTNLSTLITQTDALETLGTDANTLAATTAGRVLDGNNLLTTIDSEIGALSAAAAPADGTGNYSILAALKRGLLNWFEFLTNRLPAALGQGTMAQSLRVVLASDQSPVNTVEPATILTGQAAQTAVVNNILLVTAGAGWLDVSNFRSASIQVVSTATGGTFIFEQANDTNSPIPLPVYNAALDTGVPIVAAITATASQIIYTVPIRCQFIRLRIATALTGGSVRAFSRLSSDPWTPSIATIAQATAARLNATVSGTVTANIGTGALAAGANLIGDTGLQVRANATGAMTVNKVLAAATTNATLIKATAGRVFGWRLVNTTAALKVVRLYNLTTAPVVGTSVPAYVIFLPPNGSAEWSSDIGIAHATGISYAITNAIADLDATAVAANDVLGFILSA